MVHSLVIRKANYSHRNQGLIVTIKIEINFTTTSDTEISYYNRQVKLEGDFHIVAKTATNHASER